MKFYSLKCYDTGVHRGKIGLQAFGDFTWFSVKPADAIPFDKGIEDKLYNKSLTKVFQRALFEVMEYLQVSCSYDVMHTLSRIHFRISW